MSVVNDVLKNLDQRHAQEQFQEALPYRYQGETSSSYWLPAMLFSTLIACSVMAVNIWMQVSQDNITINLPEDLFMMDQVTRDPVLMNTVVSNSTPLINPSSPEHVNPPKIENLAQRKDQKTAQKTGLQTVQKTVQTQAMEKAVIAIKKGDDQAAKLAMIKAPKAVQDEIRLRLMVKESPQDVFPYIQRNYPNYPQEPDILAMAAQAEQRSGNHLNSISLYTKLISLQPKDARWRAGIAISLDVSGEKKAAKQMYLLAMTMPNLPSALYRFSQTRLELLR